MNDCELFDMMMPHDNDLQPTNALNPMVLTLEGMLMTLKFLQYANEFAPMDSSFESSEMEICSMLLHE